MAIVTAPATVLVTGASGFLATQLVSKLLSEGYTVVGTVRSPAKGDYLVNLFKEFEGKFSYVIVPDVEPVDAFDKIVSEDKFDAVYHTASPFHFKATDPKEVIGPAVQGTTNILESIKKNGPTVKRVVVTSSAASVSSPKPHPYTFTENDWNDASPKVIEEKGAAAPQGDKYRASKTLAEKAAWAYVEKNKSEINFALTCMNPPYIFGPTIHETSPTGLNESIDFFKNAIASPSNDPEVVARFQGCFIDVRDVAAAHVRAIQVEEAAGQRFLVSSTPFCWQDVYDTLRAAGVANVPEGIPRSQENTKYYPQDNTKVKTVLGVQIKDLKTSAVDTIESLRTRFPGIC